MPFWANLFGQKELTVRTVGFALQVLGFVLVWLDVTAAATKHKIPTVFETLRNRFKRTHHLTATGISTGSATISGKATMVVTANKSEPTLEERVAAIEQEHSAIKKDLTELRAEAKASKTEVVALIDERSRNLSEELQVIKTEIKEAAAGLIHIETIGVVLFGVGSTLSTFSNEIAGSM